MIIYNLFPLLAGTLSNWGRHIKRAADMGFEWIFVNAIQKTGRSRSLYSIADYFLIDPRFLDVVSPLAPEQQVRETTQFAKLHGLKMMADLVINHCALDSELTRHHPEWFVREPDGSIAHPFCFDNGKTLVWRDLARFDHGHSSHSDELFRFFYSVVEYLIQLGFDGFRCDAAYQIPGHFGHRLIEEVKNRHPHTVFVAETLGCTPAQTRQTAQAGFDYVFNSSKWWDYESPWLLQQYQITREVTNSISFPEDHDTDRLFRETQSNVNAVKQRCLFSSFFSAGYLIPIGFEFGFRKRMHVAKTRPDDWEEPNVDLRNFISAINSVKKHYEIFGEDCLTCVLPHENPNILVLWKSSTKTREEALIILNKDVSNHQHFHVDNLSAWLQFGGPLRDVSPEYTMGYIPHKYFSYDLQPGQGIILVTSPSQAGRNTVFQEAQHAGATYTPPSVHVPETSLCVLPWIHAYIGTTGFVQLCCVSGTGETSPPVIGSVRENSLSQLFNSDRMDGVRRQMLAGIWPAECRYCQKKEARGIKSSRHVHNEIYKSYYSQLLTHPEHFIPTICTIDLRLNNICNFKCRSCSGYASSRWFTEHNIIYPHNEMSQNVIGFDDVRSFWDEFNTRIIPTLEHVHVAGGEPLVSEAHYILIQRLLDSGNTDIELYYDTDLSQLTLNTWDAVSLWNKFSNVTLCLSLDGVGAQGEYIRHGLKYKQWLKNLETIRMKVPHAKRKLHFVVSIFNVMELRMHLRTILDSGFVTSDRLRLTFLEWPPYLNVQVLPHPLKEKCIHGLQELIHDEIAFGEAVIIQIKALLQFLSEKDLYEEYGGEFVSQVMLLDRLRGESAAVLFPYLKPMLV
ncbi:MAG: twitch domain-containing radical SAM protein [Syntrophobacteraceae bacterium]